MFLRTTMLVTAATVTAPFAGCLDFLSPCQLDETNTVRIRLVNNSETQYVSPNLGVCPNGMSQSPHHFVTPPPVLGPGEEMVYTSGEIGSCDGDCATYSTAFMIGLCGWSHGTSQDQLAAVNSPWGGQIGVQFNCGDTVTLRWTDAGDAGGTWSSEVETATGNAAPTAAFEFQQ